MNKKLISLLLAFVMVLAPVLGVVQAQAEDTLQEFDRVKRIAGEDRYETAEKVSLEVFEDNTKVAVVASGESYADSLVGGVLAAHVGGPVLLVRENSIPEAIERELDRLDLEIIYLVGGPSTVSEEVFTELKEYAPEVERLSGADRYLTSVEVANYMIEDGVDGGVAFASGRNFADALAGAAYLAELEDYVLVLSNGTTLAEDTPRSENEIVFGGPKSISVPELADAERYYGDDRFLTAVDIADRGFVEYDTVVLVDGYNFPDALTAVSIADEHDAPILLTRTETLNKDTQTAIEADQVEMVYIVGGPNSVSNDVEATLKEIMGGVVDDDDTETTEDTEDVTTDEETEYVVTPGKNTGTKDPVVTEPVAPEPEETTDNPTFEDIVIEEEKTINPESDVDELINDVTEDILDKLRDFLDSYKPAPGAKSDVVNFIASLFVEKAYANDVYTYHIKSNVDSEDLIKTDKVKTEDGWEVTFTIPLEVRKNGEFYESINFIYILNLKEVEELETYGLAFVVKGLTSGRVQVPVEVTDADGNVVVGDYNQYSQWKSTEKLPVGTYTVTFAPEDGTGVELSNMPRGAQATTESNVFTIEVNEDNLLTADGTEAWGEFQLVEVPVSVESYGLAFVVKGLTSGRVQVPVEVTDADGKVVAGDYNQYSQWKSTEELPVGTYTVTFAPEAGTGVKLSNMPRGAQATTESNVFTIEVNEDNLLTADGKEAWGEFQLVEAGLTLEELIEEARKNLKEAEERLAELQWLEVVHGGYVNQWEMAEAEQAVEEAQKALKELLNQQKPYITEEQEAFNEAVDAVPTEEEIQAIGEIFAPDDYVFTDMTTLEKDVSAEIAKVEAARAEIEVAKQAYDALSPEEKTANQAIYDGLLDIENELYRTEADIYLGAVEGYIGPDLNTMTDEELVDKIMLDDSLSIEDIDLLLGYLDLAEDALNKFQP